MKKWIAVVLFAASCASQPQPDLVIEAPRMVDVERGAYVDNVSVVITGDRITDVTTRRVRAAKTITLPAGSVLLPGLIDAHVHLAWSSSDGLEDARKTLRAGFTTVRNLGSDSAADRALRDAIESGRAEGPRMLVSGPGLGAPDGICVQVFGAAGSVSNADEARTKVREQIANGADVIKLCAGGGVVAAPRDAEALELDETILAAIVDEAHRGGRKVAAHAQSPRAIAAAARAGVDSIEHGGMIDDAAADAMIARGTVLVPTLARLRRKENYEPARNALRRRVPIVLGTDGSVLPHGQNARELRALTEIGMTPAQAIQAATIRAAKLLGWDDRTGRIARGYFADLIVVEGDPLSDVGAFERVTHVVKAGVPLIRPSGTFSP